MMDVLNSLGRPGVIVEGLAIKPGKPTMVAVVDDKLVFALPGRPFSAIIVFNLLVKPVLRKVLNLPEEGVEVEATAGARIYAERGKRTFATVKLKKEAGKVMAYPVEMESETVTMLSRAHGYVEVAEDREFVERGKKVRVRLFE
jgi:molybdopterin biosynthesis enzyme